MTPVSHLHPPGPGCFLTFEGPEGSGKSTQIRSLVDRLKSAGRRVLLTREPGGTPAGDRIRSVLLDPDGGHLEPETELFLMLAQRTEHLRKVILPAVADGVVVLCDRYFDSTLAYQGWGRGLDPQQLRDLHATFLGPYLPHQTFLFQLPPEEGLQRAKRGGRRSFDRMEAEDLAFHRRVLEGYLFLAKAEPERYSVIDASGSPEGTFSLILEVFHRRFPMLLT